MRVAIIGSRRLSIADFTEYLPKNTTEIVSGGAKGIDTSAKEFAMQKKLTYKEFLPDYRRYSRGAPHRRNIEIIEYADTILAFWDGKSRGTQHVINHCKKLGKDIRIIMTDNCEK